MSASICLSRNSRNAGHEGSPCCITTVGRGGGLRSFSVLDASGRNPPLIPEPECRERVEWRLRNLPRVLRRLEFHYTPKQVNWLNMVEIELGALKGQCLDRHVESRDRLVAEIGAWQVQRNQNGARITWMFSTDKARTKMARTYPNPSLKES